MDLHGDMVTLGQRARGASRELALLDTRRKNSVLRAMAKALDEGREALQTANAADLAAGREAGLSAAMLDRLTLTPSRITAMIEGLRSVARLKDPIGRSLRTWRRPNGLQIVKRRVPIGVICIIYESRPNVTADTAALCIKTANAIILRGGKEARHSNEAVARLLIDGGKSKGLPENAIQLVMTTDRDAIRELARLEGLVDLIMPRGGEALIRAVTDVARVPVIKHYKGVCHTYIDRDADMEMALAVAENAKCQRPGVCNAMETLVVHEAIAAEFLPRFAARVQPYGLQLKGDDAARRILPGIATAAPDDWSVEYLDLVLNVRVVSSIEEAVAHINRYGSAHSDAIVTRSQAAETVFLRDVDSATVYVNASTRFTDGAEFGMGAEIGISTDKLHARGPMALEELTTYKYEIRGTGQIRG